MKWFAETTEWPGITAPNHVYLLDDSKSKMYAFRPADGSDIKVFRSPIKIDIRGRKFVLNPVQFKTQLAEPDPEGRVWTVTGSKGDTYQVNEVRGDWSCSCSGFKFRGECKHVKELRS